MKMVIGHKDLIWISVYLGVPISEVSECFDVKTFYFVCERCGQKFETWRASKRRFCSGTCLKPAEELKILTKRRRKFLGMPVGKVNIKSGGVDWVRELVRMRDKHTCQMCGKKWNKGERRLDVHHTDEELEGKSGERGCGKSDRENIDKMITLCHRCHLNLPHIKEKMSSNMRRS